MLSKLFALKDEMLSLNLGFKPVPKIILGINISSSVIKLIEMESNHEGYKVIRLPLKVCRHFRLER